MDVPVPGGRPIPDGTRYSRRHRGAGAVANRLENSPFAITVLAPPEILADATIRVPVRITGTIPRWAHDDAAGLLSCLTDTRWEDVGRDDEGQQWYIRPSDPDSPLLPEGSDPFQGVILAQGCSHDGFLYLGEDEGKSGNAMLGQSFAELHYVDEKVILVDLSRSVPPAERS